MAGDIIRIAKLRVSPPCTAFGAAWLLVLSACHGDSNAPPPTASPTVQAAAPVVAKKGPTADELTVGMVEAALQGKAGVPLDVKFELAQRPKVGQPLEINLALMPQAAGSPLALQVVSGDGIDLGSSNHPYEVSSVEAGAVYRHTVRVTPTAEGVLILLLTVSLKHDEVTDSAGFSIPIIADR